MARAILEQFASRAYRRPVTESELTKLMKLVDLAIAQGDRFEQRHPTGRAGGSGFARVPLSRRARVARQEAHRPAPGAADGGQWIGDFELASRLSYFLWSSMPDDELWRAAVAGSLRSAGESLEQAGSAHAPRSQGPGPGRQLRRRSGCSFATCKSVNPDHGRFPSFDERAARGDDPRDRAVLSLRSCVATSRSSTSSMPTSLTSTSGWHVTTGLPGVKGEQFRRVKLKDRRARRPGDAGEHLDRDVQPDPHLAREAGQVGPRATAGHAASAAASQCAHCSRRIRKRSPRRPLRLRMEQHRAKAAARSATASWIPLGFGLENFDAVGAWRDKDGGAPVDSSGTLPSGESFRGPRELKAILKAQRAEFTRCLTEKMLTYALGRGLEDYDHCAVDQIVKSLEASRYRFSALVLGIVKSDPFQKRRDRD